MNPAHSNSLPDGVGGHAGVIPLDTTAHANTIAPMLTNTSTHTVSTARSSRTVVRSVVRSSAVVVAFAALTFVGANIVIPLVPVPITMQTLFVLLAGAMIGARRGALSQALYLGAGSVGLPIFAGGLAGSAVVLGPTGGYLMAFAVTPFIVGTLLGRSRSLLWQVGVFALGTAVIFLMGVAHLAVFYTHSLGTALQLGLVPFLPGAAFKLVAAVSIYRSWTALREGRGAKRDA